MENKDLKQGTRIEFDIQTLKGNGKIVGVALNALPIVGKMYIIEPDEQITSDIYDYSHFVVRKCHLKVLD